MFITSLTEISNFKQMIPFIGDIIEKIPDFLVGLVNNALSMIILATWLSFLPDILMLLSEIQGIETYSWLEKALLNKYYFYQIFNVILFFVIGKVAVQLIRYFSITEAISFWDYINTKPIDLMKNIASSLIKLSPFYVNYTMLQTFLIISVQLIYPAPIAKSLFAWIFKFIGIKKTPRDYSNLSDPRVFSLNYGYISTLPLVLFTVVMIFSCICPIIPCIGTLYFAYAFLVYKYQLMYIQHPRYESYGSFVPLYINRCLFGIFVFQLTMIGILCIKNSIQFDTTNKNYQSSIYGFLKMIYMLPLLLSTFFVYWWFKQSFEKHFKFIPLEVIAKRLNVDNCIVNSSATMRTESSIDNLASSYSYCSYCGSHDIITSKTPLNKQRSDSNSSLKDISAALRRRTSLERDNSSSNLNSNKNTKSNDNNNSSINKSSMKNNDKEMSYSSFQEINLSVEKIDANQNCFVSKNKLKKKSPLGKEKQSNTLLYQEGIFFFFFFFFFFIFFFFFNLIT